jgi:hypothetical protein
MSCDFCVVPQNHCKIVSTFLSFEARVKQKKIMNFVSLSRQKLFETTSFSYKYLKILISKQVHTL